MFNFTIVGNAYCAILFLRHFHHHAERGEVADIELGWRVLVLAQLVLHFADAVVEHIHIVQGTHHFGHHPVAVVVDMGEILGARLCRENTKYLG